MLVSTCLAGFLQAVMCLSAACCPCHPCYTAVPAGSPSFLPALGAAQTAGTRLLTAMCSSSCTPALCVLCAQEEKALKALKEKAKTGSVGGAGLKKSGKK
jgi:hypothetical protein